MRKKSAFFGAAFWAILACHLFVLAQISPDLRDPAYKNGVLEKIAGLVESKYVLADKAKDQAADAALDSLFKIARRAGMISEFFNFVFAYNFQSPLDERMQLAILMKNIEFFPQSFTAYELLATVCESKGNKDLALRYFLKVLEFDPGNRNAVRKIQELQK
jgi:tetratricopeptide (TPR) repeat protein